MKLGFRILAQSLILFIALTVNATDKCHKSTEGTNFWFGFMETRNYRTGHYVDITVTAREPTKFTITIGTDTTTIYGTYNVAGNGSRRVTISSWDIVEATGSEQILNKGIHLISEKPVNVYALSYSENSSDVAVIYPVESLGTKYYAMCYTPTVSENPNGTYLHGRNSEFLVVAANDSTEIEITPSVETDQLKPKGVPFKITLHKGQVYQVQSKNRNNQNTRNQGDLTGSMIKSTKPVAFYSGSLSTTVPANSCCWDHLYEQIPPVHSWGKEFYIVPLKSRLSDRYRIMACEDNTTINVGVNLPVFLNQAEFYEFELDHDNPVRVLSDKPIMIAQFSQSRDVDNSYTSGNGDPFMIILSPITQNKNDVTFVAYESNQIKKYFLNIISLTSETGNLHLTDSSGNEIPISNSFQSFPGREYSYAQVTLSNGTYRLWNTKADKGFLAYVYGYGGVESYGYGVGFNLDLVLDLGKSIQFEGDTLALCFGESITLDAGPYFDTYLWNDSTTEQRLTVTEEAKYWALTTTNEGCVLFDSIYIKMSHPIVNIPVESDEGCAPFVVALNADSGFVKYTWKNELDEILSEDRNIILDQTGLYQLTVSNEFNCQAKDTFTLTVFEVPGVEIEADTLVCGNLNVDLNAVISSSNPQLWDFPGSMKWRTNKPASGNFSVTDGEQTVFTVKNYGNYEVYFTLTTSEGCVSNDSITILFQETPTSAFDFGEDKKCEGYSKKLLFQGTASDDARFFWDLDGCMLTDTIGYRQYNVTVGAFLETQPMISLVINDHGCLSDTTVKPLGANPVYAMEASPTRGCDSLVTTFSCRLLKPDKVEYTWDFGNNDIVHDSVVTRRYNNPGFYNVSLKILNPVTQCMNGFTLDSMIKIYPTPTAKMKVDETACYPDSFQAVYLNNIDSSFCYWSFAGAHSSGPGNDSIMVVIDSATAKISLTVSEYGCPSDTIWNDIKRKPDFDILCDTTTGCQPYTLKVWGVSSDPNLEYFWIRDSLQTEKADTSIYRFNQPGIFGITLFATSSETQCTDTLWKVNYIRVHPKPEASFEVDFPVATIEHPTLTFTNLSPSGITHLWDFGDGSGSELFSPRHSYSQLGDYITNLRITNEFGCPDTSFLTIKIVPFSIYTPNAFRPDSPIEENRFFYAGRDRGRSCTIQY